MTVTSVGVPRQRSQVGPVPAAHRGDVRRLVLDVVTVVSLLAAWMVVQLIFLSGISESRSQQTLFTTFRQQLAAATAPTGGVIDPGAPVAILTVPDLGLRTVVVEGTASGDLLTGPGHRRDTVLPGQQGVSLVYGRARTYGAPFHDITRLTPGMDIVARTAQGRAVFLVDGVRRSGDPVPPAPQPGRARLTLVSGQGTGAAGSLTAGETVYVDASLAGDGFVPPTGRLSATPDSEHAMGTDSTALPALVVLLAALTAITAATSAVSRRWRLSVVWVIAVPILLASAWVTTDVGVRLLPNLL